MNLPGQLIRVEIDLNSVKDGIIRYVGAESERKKNKAIASKSVFSERSTFAVHGITNISAHEQIESKDEPDQRVCWDFRRQDVISTHDTIVRIGLKSRVVESSVDDLEWAKIDRQTDRDEAAQGELG
jgi:uncharacterized protein (DUF1499 family)